MAVRGMVGFVNAERAVMKTSDHKIRDVFDKKATPNLG
jgi:hypothetical protein